MTISKVTPIALALVFAAGTALAQDYRGDDAEEVNALAEVQVSLADAINTAETETSGTALEATLEVERGETFYEIDVFAENSIKHVYVNAADGSVLAVEEDWD